MLGAPGIAIDLPLKILVWEDIVEKYGFPTIARHIYRSGVAYRGRWCRTSRWWRRWQPRPQNSFLLDPQTTGGRFPPFPRVALRT